MIADLIRDAEKKMGISTDHLHHELGKLRTGQASVALLDDLKVDYYGTPTPLKQVATLGAPDSQTLTIQPWEASVLKEIEKIIVLFYLGSGNVQRVDMQLVLFTRKREINVRALI